MDELVDSMDDLPQLMAKMQTNSQRDPTSVSSNLNSECNSMLQCHDSCNPSIFAEANMISDPSQQRSQASEQSDLTSIASKVKDSLSKLSADSPQSIKNDKQRPTYETSSKKLAEIAKKALENMKKVQKENNSQSIYRVYDTHQRGTITYNDFAEVMVHTAAGISKSTARQLARELDSNQSGLIDYRNITQKLSDLATIEIAPSYPPLPSESATVEAIQNNHRNSPEKTLRVPSKVSDKNMSSNSYHIPSESKEKYNDIVDVQSLSPTLQTVRTNNQSKTRSIEENRERIIKGEGVKKVLVHDDQNQFVDALDPLYTPRRHYTHHHKSKLPYALDYHVKGSIDIEPVLKGKKRPSSAPSRHSTVHQLFQMVEEVQSAKEIGSYPTLRDIYDHSVNASTKGSNNNNEDHIQQSPQPKPRRFSCTTRNNNIASIVSQIYPQGSPQIKASRESLHESLVPPALITASQVDGKINGLRHQLKKADKSKSGYVNFSEFQSAFNKLGLQVAKDDLKKLFHENSVVNHQAIGRDVGVGYSHGKGVKIEDFIDVIETNSSKSNESKGNSVRQSLESQKQVAKGAEQRRILRSVMLGLERSTDPLAIFHRYDKHHNGYIQPEHLRLGLQEMGISMSDREYKLFSQAVDVNHDGKIDVKEFKSLFDEKLNQHDREELHQKYQQLNQHPKYSNSYRSASDIINHTYSDKTTPSGGRDGGLNNSIGFSRRYSLSQERDSAGGGEYDTQHILNSKSLKMQSIRLSKLKQNLIENKEKVLKSFLTPLQSIQRRYGQQELDDLSYVELVQRFEKNGIHLGKDDRDQLQIQLNRYLSDQKHLERNYECHGSNQISVDTFCNAIGIGIDKIGEKTGPLLRRYPFAGTLISLGLSLLTNCLGL